jgi:hypothetical protein
LRTTPFKIRAAARIAAWLCIAWAAMVCAAPARELAATTTEEITVLQQRLTDAGCYRGAIDGASGAALDAAVRACPDQRPVLRIETGMHTGEIRAIGVDAACGLLVTASLDKTARLWSLPDGHLLHTLRLPIGDGYDGRIYAAAITPDGKTIAIGGWAANFERDKTVSVYLFDAATGLLTRSLGPFESPVNKLEFTHDGARLLVALAHGGVRVMDMASGEELMADRQYDDQVFAITLAPDDTIFAAGLDGYIRRYDRRLRRAAANRLRGQVYSIAVAGRTLAAAYSDLTGLDLFDADSLKLLGAADLGDLPSGSRVSAVSPMPDGTRFSAFIEAPDPSNFVRLRFITRTFDLRGRRLGADHPVEVSNLVLSLQPCGQRLVFGSLEPSFGFIDPDGATEVLGRHHQIDSRNKYGDGFLVSESGAKVRFGLEHGAGDPVTFDLIDGSLVSSPAAPADLLPVDWDGLLGHITNGTPPTFDGKPLTFDSRDTMNSFAMRRDKQGFVIGSDFKLQAFKIDGGLLWTNLTDEPTRGENIVQGGRLVLVVYDDGTIRWHRWSDGKELLALFVDTRSKRWVAWTPAGYYMASPGGEDLIGWHVNRGWNQPADFFPASRFRDRFNRPDIVKLVLETLDEDAAVKQADAKAHRREETKPLVTQLPPLIRISDPPDGGRVAMAETKIDYVWRSPSGLPVDAIEVLIDGRPVKDETLPVRRADANTEVQGSLKFAMPPHDVEVGLIAYSGDIKSETAAVKLTWTGAVAPKSQPHRMHALIAGVSDYASPDMALAYAAKDARDFAHALEGQKGGYYSEVETRVIVDRDVTRASLIDGLDWLAKQADGPDDVSVLFLAGHGLTDDKLTYWFLPSDATEDQAHGKGLSQEDVRRALRSAPGKVVWFLDTCHAGGAQKRSLVDVNILINTVTSAENGGIVAFASSEGNETSLESSAWKNGAFTKALVEGVELGRAAAFGRDAINTSLLDAYLQTRVNELTDGAQHPVMQRPPQVTDFTFALARKP